MNDAKDALRRLAEARPDHYDPGTQLDPATRRAELSRAMAAERAPGPTARRRSRRPAWGLGLVAAATVVAVGVTTVVSDTGEPPVAEPGIGRFPEPVDLDARTVLLAAADGALRQPRTTGRYWHTRVEYGALERVGPPSRPYVLTHRYRHDGWDPRVPTDEGWFRSEDLGARPATPADEAAWRADGSPTSWRLRVPGTKGGPVRGGIQLEMHPKDSAYAHSTGRPADAPDELNVTQKELNEAPDDPAALRRLLLNHPLGEADDGKETDAELFEAAAVILLARPLPPSKRAAIYRMLAGIKGVTATGGVTDATGRRGIALKIRDRYPDGDVEIRFVVDRTTGAGLSKEIHYLKGRGEKSWLKPGTRWYSEVWHSEWVDTLPPMPRGPRGVNGGDRPTPTTSP
ncbi:CU044_5270 family protein [Thermomonospora umbrina]|uniref:CU044_5270 family protein n=1 Tax=Thermomonospora umbrina TaxID=111806 RepID=A0A3D9SRA4_9ACTN|nr:CU044_5270 family protein [Thermomonospora umbrina]REE97040.1 hypothetical protein DFJ69_2496 [Thermomonospora umbrina]